MATLSNKTIDIIIPCYNSEETIERALESLAEQTNRDFNVIIVDDGSSDKTVEVAEGCASKNGLSLITVTHEVNKGTAAAMNTGVSASANDWITFLGSDDRLDRSWLDDMIAVKEREPEYDVYACTAYLIDTDGVSIHHKKGMDSGEIKLSDIYVRNMILSAGCFVKRQMFCDVGGFTVGMYNEDYDLWMRVLAKGYKIYEEINPLYYYYIGGEGQVTANQRLIVSSSTIARLNLIRSGLLNKSDIDGFTRGMHKCWRDLIVFEHSKYLNEKFKGCTSRIKNNFAQKVFNKSSDCARKIILGLSLPAYNAQADKEIRKIDAELNKS